MSPSAIYSKSGKGVQEASGKTSLLARSDRAVLSAFDGKMTLQEVADKVGKPFDAKFEALVAQLDKDGFVRQVSAGAPIPTTPKPAPAARPAAPAGGKAPGEDLDFTIAMPAPKAAAPKPAAPPPAPPVAPQMAQSNAAAFAKAREEAEEKAAKERDRIKAETEAKMRAEMEAKMRSEAELKAKSDAEARVKAEAEAKIKAAREAAARVAAEAKAKAEAEAAAKLEAERARVREAEEKARKEAEAAKRAAEEAKRKAEEEARKAREEAERIRKEAEEAKRQAEEAKRKAEEEARRIREEAERRAKEEEQRRAKEEAERKAREAREKQEREKAEAERKAREKAEREQEENAEKERKARERAEREQREREEEERESREKAERKAREKAEREQREREEEEREEAERQAKKARERAAREEADGEKAAAAPAPKAAQASPKADFGDSLLADLDSFSQREDEDRKAKEEATRKEKEAAARRAKEAEEEAKRKAEREEREEAERKEKERKRKEEEARAKEEEERRQREEQEREREKQEAERRRKARAKDDAKPASDDIEVSEDDLDMDEVKKDEALLSKESRRAAREREERERQAKKDAKREAKREAKDAKEDKRAKREEPAYSAPPQFRRPRKWGKTVSMTLFLLLVAGVGALHVMPISTAEYEKAAGDALGRPVKISSARLSLYSGVMLKFDGVSIGEAKIAAVRAFPEIGSLFNEKKAFSRIELEGVSVPQESIGALFGAKVRGDHFTVSRVNARQVKVTGPVPLPTLEVDLALGSDGAVTSTSLRGADGLSGKLTPKNANEMDVDVVANSFTVPILPDMTLSGFALKGVATRDGIRIESWGGGQLDGAVSGSANIRWSGGNWTIDGVMTVRGINAAVFAPALLSEGKAEGSGRFSFNDPDPMAFLGRGRIEGTFSVHKGVLGSFDLSRAITTGGRQVGGRTPFTGMSGQGVFDKGSVALRNVSFGAGALNAGASADITADGALSGRIVADVRTPSQTLRATLNLGGTVRDPQVRN